MTNCEHCQGQIQPDEDGASCLQCGRRLYWNANVRDVRVSEILRALINPPKLPALLNVSDLDMLEAIVVTSVH